MPLLLAILPLAAVDSLNPASITGAVYLARSGRARLNAFIIAVYLTYGAIAVALTLGPASAARSALRHASAVLAQPLELALALLLIGLGVRAWRRRGASADAPFGTRRSGFVLGFAATVADLPTAGPLLAASALIAAESSGAPAKLAAVALYDLVYLLPLVAVLAVGGRLRAPGLERLRRWAPIAVASICFTGGAVLASEAVATLL